MKNFITLCAWLALACMIGCACLLKAQSPTRGVWVEEPSMQELQYRVSFDGPVVTCAAIGIAGDGWFYVDIVRPRREEDVQSTEVNTFYGAKLFAEKACR